MALEHTQTCTLQARGIPPVSGGCWLLIPLPPATCTGTNSCTCILMQIWSTYDSARARGSQMIFTNKVQRRSVGPVLPIDRPVRTKMPQKSRTTSSGGIRRSCSELGLEKLGFEEQNNKCNMLLNQLGLPQSALVFMYIGRGNHLFDG